MRAGPTFANALEPLLTPFAHAVAGIAATCWGSLEHALGFVALTEGHRDAALRWFERAQRADEAMRTAAWSRRSAEMLAEARSSGRGAVRRVS